MENSVLNVTISRFLHYWKTEEPIDANLLEILQSGKYEEQVKYVRSIQDKELRKKAKVRMECFTVSGRFKKREAEAMLEHSGLLCLDLDGVEDIVTLKQQVCELRFIAYCGRSCGGGGLFAIIPIPKSDAKTHGLRYAALENYFIDKFGITGAVDPVPKSVVSLRYVSHDPDAYFNHNAEVYDRLPVAPKHTFTSSVEYRKLNLVPAEKKIQRLLAEIKKNEIDLCPDYGDYIKVAFVFANLFGEDGRQYFYDACRYNCKYDETNAKNKFDSAKKKGEEKTNKVGLKTFLRLCDAALLDTSDYEGEYQEAAVSWSNDDTFQTEVVPDEAQEEGSTFLHVAPLNPFAHTSAQAVRILEQPKTKAEELTELGTDDILNVSIEVNAGEVFDNLNLVTLRTKKGYYDVIFDKHGEPFEKSHNPVLFKLFSKEYSKSFIPMLLNSTVVYGCIVQ